LLGSGLGLPAASPWSDNSGVAFGIGAILWLTFNQLAASAIGGYMAGRLRVKWASLHTDEMYFRDTAHGLLAWALSTMLVAALFSSVISGDLLQETMRILANSIENGSLADDDRACLAKRIAARTGLDQAAAEKRVDDVYARGGGAAAKAKATAKEAAKEAADTARKAAAVTALWLTVAMLTGAFVANMTHR